jgi:HlyD family secretion protein
MDAPHRRAKRRLFKLLALSAGIGLVALVLYCLSRPIRGVATIDGSVIQAERVQRGSFLREALGRGSLVRDAATGAVRPDVQFAIEEATGVTVGQNAELDTLQGPLSGHIVRVTPARKVAAESETSVEVALDGSTPKDFAINSPVTAKIRIENLDNVLYIARAACCSPYATAWLFKLSPKGDAGTRTEIRFGGASRDRIEILRGVHEGDGIVVSDLSNWDNINRVSFNPGVIRTAAAGIR